MNLSSIFRPSRRFPSIPFITGELGNHTQALTALKEIAEVGKRDTADILNSFVRVQDLINLDLISAEGIAIAAGGDGAGFEYLIQTEADKSWGLTEFVHGYNIIGVREAGATVRIPHDLPTEYIVAVKDETGSGGIEVTIY